MMKRDVPVYLITGFLESGKTQFLDFTIHQSYFQIPDKTLLILCEEGEEEYDEESLKKMNTVIEIIEDPEDFNADTLQMLNKKHHPGRVLVEYNPLWSVDKFYQTDMPRYWDLAQHIVTVDASTFQIYMNNMKSLFMEMIRNADLVIFNRCQDEHPLANLHLPVFINPITASCITSVYISKAGTSGLFPNPPNTAFAMFPTPDCNGKNSLGIKPAFS